MVNPTIDRICVIAVQMYHQIDDNYGDILRGDVLVQPAIPQSVPRFMCASECTSISLPKPSCHRDVAGETSAGGNDDI